MGIFRRQEPQQPEWWNFHTNLAALWDWLYERGEAPPTVPFLEKPWKWDYDWHHYLRWRAGERCPADDCPFLADECREHGTATA